MQAVERETLILYHSDLRGQWPRAASRAFVARLPYARRLALRAARDVDRASLAGIALALRALERVLGRRVSAGELKFHAGAKPRLASRAADAAGAAGAAGAAADFSISHSGAYVGCVAVARGCVGLDIEVGTQPRIAQWVLREAALKATGEGLRGWRASDAPHSRADGTVWRGRHWHVRRLELFPGAAAAVVASEPVQALETQAVALEELFDA
jgi:4'-phosphopantetheinyl transferase